MKTNLDDLYRDYGTLMVQAELIQGQINLVKQQINEAISKPFAVPGTPPSTPPTDQPPLTEPTS
jgi:hypothetical protein